MSGDDGRIDLDIASDTTDRSGASPGRYANRIEIEAGPDGAEIRVRGIGRRRSRIDATDRARRSLLHELRQEMIRTAEYDKPIVSRFKAAKPEPPALDDPEAIVPCPVCHGEWGECEACFGDGVMTARRAAEVG